MKLHYIDPDYVAFLRTIDSKVQHNYDDQAQRHTKPYVGIILTIQGKDFYAPITSNSPAKKAKRKFESISDSAKTIHKIRDGEDILAVVSINNMIPADSRWVKEIDFSQISDKKYLNLLQKEVRFLTQTREKLQKKANFLYKQVAFVPNSHFANICCNFKALEEACEQYMG